MRPYRTLSMLSGSNHPSGSPISIWEFCSKARDKRNRHSPSLKKQRSSTLVTPPFIGGSEGSINPWVEKRKPWMNLLRQRACCKRTSFHFESRFTKPTPSHQIGRASCRERV